MSRHSAARKFGRHPGHVSGGSQNQVSPRPLPDGDGTAFSKNLRLRFSSHERSSHRLIPPPLQDINGGPRRRRSLSLFRLRMATERAFSVESSG